MLWAISANFVISAISVSGFEGVSRKSSFVSGVIAVSHALIVGQVNKCGRNTVSRQYVCSKVDRCTKILRDETI